VLGKKNKGYMMHHNNVWNKNDYAEGIDKYWEVTNNEQDHRIHLAETINKYLEENTIMLDAGCGSGEVYKRLSNYLKNKNVRYFGWKHPIYR
jgi:ubiquinone/menaquinone biosynthesis C-methylase UbiE